MQKLMIACAALLVLCSCLKEEQDYAVIRIKANPPASQPGLDLSAIEVQLQNKEEPITHKKNFDSNGFVEFRVSPSRYSILASALYPSGFAVSGSAVEFLLTRDGVINDQGVATDPTIWITLDVGISGSIIFREVYYAGSKTSLNTNYSKDQYFEIYNNGEEIYYLDSLCIGSVMPVNSTSASNAWAGKDTIALFQMVWMIPGAGQDYPLYPGESAVIALNAIDHRPRSTSGLDLSKAHFGFYDIALTGHEKAPDVPALTRIVSGLGSAYSMSVGSPALVIFRPIMGVRAYLNDPVTWERYEPGKVSGTKYWHVDKAWILDGVECVASPERALKRLPGSVDAAYTYLRDGSNLGNCVTRKVKEIRPDGRVIYQDTNNSADDFISDVKAAPRLKQ